MVGKSRNVWLAFYFSMVFMVSTAIWLSLSEVYELTHTHVVQFAQVDKSF